MAITHLTPSRDAALALGSRASCIEKTKAKLPPAIQKPAYMPLIQF